LIFISIFALQNRTSMKPLVSIIMGSTSDLPVMEAAAKFLNEMQIPFEINALSAHRTPEKVEEFAKGAYGRGIRVIIAAAGMAAHLPGVIAAMTTLPVIGVPIKASLEGLDSLLAIVQMPPGIPVATVGINGAQNAAILAAEILATGDDALHKKMVKFKEDLKKKIIKANEELAAVKFEYRVG
jgi:5-(carboxyamino)imidazole ribonucleotide mutase